jgi:chromosome segregation ATPase
MKIKGNRDVTKQEVKAWADLEVKSLQTYLAFEHKELETEVKKESDKFSAGILSEYSKDFKKKQLKLNVQLVVTEGAKIIQNAVESIVSTGVTLIATHGASVAAELLKAATGIQGGVSKIKTSVDKISESWHSENGALQRLETAYKEVRKAVEKIETEAADLDRYTVVRNTELKTMDTEFDDLAKKIQTAAAAHSAEFKGAVEKLNAMKSQFTQIEFTKKEMTEKIEKALKDIKTVTDAVGKQPAIAATALQKAEAFYKENSGLLAGLKAVGESVQDYVK